MQSGGCFSYFLLRLLTSLYIYIYVYKEPATNRLDLKYALALDLEDSRRFGKLYIYKLGERCFICHVKLDDDVDGDSTIISSYTCGCEYV